MIFRLLALGLNIFVADSETYRADAPSSLVDLALSMRSKFQEIDDQFDDLFLLFEQDNDEATKALLIEQIVKNRPVQYAELVFQFTKELELMKNRSFQGIHQATGLSNCEVALVIGTEVIHNVPHAYTLQDRHHSYHDALYKLSTLMMHLFNDYTCLKQVQQFYDFPGKPTKQPFLLFLAHHLDRASIRYFDLVDHKHAQDLDPSEPSEEYLIRDLQHTVDQLIMFDGNELETALHNNDSPKLKKWSVDHTIELPYGVPDYAYSQHWDDSQWAQWTDFQQQVQKLAESLIFRHRERLQQLAEEEQQWFYRYSATMGPLLAVLPPVHGEL